MRSPFRPALAVAVLLTSSLAAPLGAGASPTAPTSPTPAPRPPAAPAKASPTVLARTSAQEARRVDHVKLKLDWFDCGVGTTTLKCAIAKLPLDYDKPNGPTTDVALLKRPADKPGQKVGTLFVNPGGPGGSAVQMAASAEAFLSPKLLASFDVVGMDPRGVNASAQVKCFPSTGDQVKALAGMAIGFPKGAAQEKTYKASAAKLARGCSTTGRPLTAHASTAEVARDMDVVRRTLGDRKLTYLGFSYGTYLGQVYANMFPDRVRALTIDGVLDAAAWAGTRATRDVPVTLRIRSGDGAWRALQEIMRRCDAAGTERCVIAGNAMGRFEAIAKQLEKGPITLDYGGGSTVELTYADYVSTILSALYRTNAGDVVASLVQQVEVLGTPSAPAAQRAAAARAFRSLHQELTSSGSASSPQAKALAKAFGRGFDFAYDNSQESFSTVLCTDSLNPSAQDAWSRQVPRWAAAAPYFTESWGWGSLPCAGSSWTVRDTERWAGPFTLASAKPVLVVGDYWDPATNYEGAVTAARTLGHARLLTSDSWGHTAYGTSACVTSAVDSYLLDGKLPAAGTVCTGDDQPFQQVRSSAVRAAAATAPVAAKPLKPGVATGPSPRLG